MAIEYPKQGRVPAFRAVEGANLVIYPGQVVGLVGESGSGKTTIGRAAVGLLPVAAGTMRVVGQDISAAKKNGKQLHQVRRHIGMVFQDPSSSLNPRLPIGESIGEPMFLAGEAKEAGCRSGSRPCLTRLSCRGATATGTRMNCPAGKSSAWALPGRCRSSRS